MIKTILKLAEYLGVSPKTISYLATVIITIVVTVPATFTVQSASEVKNTLDTVVVNQKRLEKSLNTVFSHLGERVNEIGQQQQEILNRQNSFRTIYLRYQKSQNDMILKNSEGTKYFPVFKERIHGMEKVQYDYLTEDEEE